MTKVLARDPARRCLPSAEWPAEDRHLWEAALLPGDLLEDGGIRSRYAGVSNRKVAKGYGRWLAWLAWTKQLDAAVGPADRITEAQVAAYVMALERINGTYTLLARLQELYEAAIVMDPRASWYWIRRIAGRVRARHAPARSKRNRLVGAAELFGLGRRLMARAGHRGTSRQQAIDYRDGLIVALLAARPIRLRNLAGLEVDRTLVHRANAWWIMIPAIETKTREPVEEPLPWALGPALAVYLAEHRPLLAKRTGRWAAPVGNALWVSSDGSPMTRQTLYDRIVGRTDAAFGRPVNPHLFRDYAATSIAIEDPEHVYFAARLLGHRSIATTERHYNQAQALEAARRWQSCLLDLRRGSRNRRSSAAEVA